MRRAILVIALLAAACHRDAATGTAGHPARVSDDELVAFTRWQREYAELFNKHWTELHAVGSDDPNAVLRDPKAFEARVAELTARQAPVMKAHLDRRPLKDDRAELATEAVGGIFHYEHGPDGYKLVVARDEMRLDAARRRFGKDAIDDIVAREPLILAALRGE